MYKFPAATVQSCQAYCERRGDVGLKPAAHGRAMSSAQDALERPTYGVLQTVVVGL